jgi:flagellar basal-body rod protein FlgB
MPDKLSFESTFDALERATIITQRRHSLITANISESDTPYYRPKELDFKKALAEAMEPAAKAPMAKTDPKHLSPDPGPVQGMDGVEEESEWNGFNWVNIDKEMTKLTENDLMYRTATEALLRKITLLKEVIREGGR